MSDTEWGKFQTQPKRMDEASNKMSEKGEELVIASENFMGVRMATRYKMN